MLPGLRAEEGIERVWPMDPVPRIIPADEWRQIEAGLVQDRIDLLRDADELG